MYTEFETYTRYSQCISEQTGSVWWVLVPGGWLCTCAKWGVSCWQVGIIFSISIDFSLSHAHDKTNNTIFNSKAELKISSLSYFIWYSHCGCLQHAPNEFLAHGKDGFSLLFNDFPWQTKSLPKECFALCEENLWFDNRAIDLFHPTFHSLHGNDKVNECKISVGETGRRVYYTGKLR